MIGSPRTELRLDDYRPTREHWVLLGVALLFVCLFTFTETRTLIGDPRAQKMYGSVITFLVIWGFAQAKGGLYRVARDWYNANWWGYYYVLWMTSPNNADGHVINYKNYSKTVMARWNLYVPLGGWFRKPFLTHNGIRTTNFWVEKVHWDWNAASMGITVSDNDGNRLSAHYSWFLNRLEQLVPSGQAEGKWTNGLMVLISDGERGLETKLSEVTRDRDGLKFHWGTLVRTLDYVRRDIARIVDCVEAKDRLKVTREWKWARTELSGLCKDPTGSLYDAMQGAGTSAGPKPDHSE